MLHQIYLISVTSGQLGRAEAKLAAPVEVRLAPQNLRGQKQNHPSLVFVKVLRAELKEEVKRLEKV